MKTKNLVLMLVANALLVMSGSVFAQVELSLALLCGETEQGYVGDENYCAEAKISCGALSGTASIDMTQDAVARFLYEADAYFATCEFCDGLGCSSSGSWHDVAQGTSWSCNMPEGTFNLTINEVAVVKCIEYCGDFIIQKPEQCDDGPDGSPACTSDCRVIRIRK